MIKAEYDLKIFTINELIETKDKTKKLKIKSLEGFYDLCIFNSITSLDLDVVLDGFFNSTSDWQKRFYVRSMVLIIHEHLEIIHKLMNSKFYNFLSSNPIFRIIHNDINNNRKNYKELNKKKTSLHELRKNVIAHRNEGGEDLYNSINSLDLKEILNLSLELQVCKNINRYNQNNS